MIRTKYFDKNDKAFMDAFMDEHPPRATKDSGGITIVQDGVYVVYDDGPLSTSEQVSWITDQIRTKRVEILNGEADFRKKITEQPILEQEIVDLEQEIKDWDATDKSREHREELEKKEKGLEFKKAVLTEMDNFILMSEKNKEDATKKIAALQSMLDDIKSGKDIIA